MKYHAEQGNRTRRRALRILAAALAQVMIVVGVFIGRPEPPPGETTVQRPAEVVHVAPPARDVQEWIRDALRGGPPGGGTASDAGAGRTD